MARRSIEVPGLQHGAPIPQASVVGNLLVSGGISPVDPETGVTPDGADEQVAMVFAARERGAASARVAGRDVLLIDDIYTTGATARACSRVLKTAGAASVRVVTVARAQREGVATWDPEVLNQHFVDTHVGPPER